MTLQYKVFQSYSFAIHWLFHLFAQPIISPIFALSYTFSAFCLRVLTFYANIKTTLRKALFERCCATLYSRIREGTKPDENTGQH